MSRALIVVDVQESFRARDDWSTFANQAVAHQVQGLVDAARTAGDSVFWILHCEPGSGGVFDPTLGYVRIMSELSPAAAEPVVTKTSVNAFTSTNLHQELAQRGVRELLICGIRTEQCCETTARVASDLGFDVVFITDATTTSPAGSLTAAQIIERTEQVLQARGFASIRTTREMTVGPAQVFSTAASHGLPYQLHYVAADARVDTAQSLAVQAQTTLPAMTTHDLLVVPGWRSRRLADAAPLPQSLRAALAEHHRGGGTVASVCSGADALGQAGLLDGRRCTTHHEHQDELARRYPRARVVRDVLFTEDDRVVTSAGIASGIDLALHLVANRHGPAAAARVARSMVVYTRRNGDAPQDSAMLRHRVHLSDQVHRAQEIIERRYPEPLRLTDLAAAVGVSERTLTRRFADATGLTPLRYQQALRLEQAETLIEQGSSVERAARTVGFEDARMLRRLRAGR